MLGSADCLHICCVYTHVNQHIFSAHQVLLQQSINHQSKKIAARRIFSKYQFTLLVASFGSFGKPLTEFESIERKTCIGETPGKMFSFVRMDIMQTISIVYFFLLAGKFESKIYSVLPLYQFSQVSRPTSIVSYDLIT